MNWRPTPRPSIPPEGRVRCCVRWLPVVSLLLPLWALAEEGIPYLTVPAEADETESYVQITAGSVEEQEVPLVEVPPDRYSGGSRDGRTVYRDMDYDDLDSESMIEVWPAATPRRAPAPPTVVPASTGDLGTVVVPADRISRPQPGAEDRIFRQTNGVPPDPGASPRVPDQERVYIPPGLSPGS